MARQASPPRSCACPRPAHPRPRTTTASSTASRASPSGQYLQNKIAANAEKLSVRAAANDLVAVASMLETQFRSERRPSTSPSRPSRWSTTSPRPGQGRATQERRVQVAADAERRVIDLQADVDHDLRARLRTVTRHADEALEASDRPRPGRVPGLALRRVAEDVVHNYTFLHARAQDLTAGGRALRRGGSDIVVELDVPTPPRCSRRSTAARHRAEPHGRRHPGPLRPSRAATRHAHVRHAGADGGLAWPTPPPSSSAVHGPLGPQGREGPAAGHASQPGAPGAPQVQRRGRFVVARTPAHPPPHAAPHARLLRRPAEERTADQRRVNAAQQAIKSDANTRQKRLRDVEAELKRIGVLRDKAYALAPT